MLERSVTLSMPKTVGTVGAWEQCPLTLAITGFLCTHQGNVGMGNSGNSPRPIGVVPTVPTLFPLLRSVSGNGATPCCIRSTVICNGLVPTVPTIYHSSGGGAHEVDAASAAVGDYLRLLPGRDLSSSALPHRSLRRLSQDGVEGYQETFGSCLDMLNHGALCACQVERLPQKRADTITTEELIYAQA